MSEDAPLVAGFADPAGVVAGTCWRFGETTGGVLLAGEAVTPAEVTIAGEGEGRLELEISAGEASGRATLVLGVALSDEDDAEGKAGIGVSCASADATVEFELQGKSRTLSCPGHWLRWDADARSGSDLLRHAAVPEGEEGVLLFVARRAEGEGGHDHEAAAAFRASREHLDAFREPLLSTQYDGDGLPTRIGLELWLGTEDETHATRAAGTTIGTVEADGVTAAMLRTSAEGHEGIGSYLIWRR